MQFISVFLNIAKFADFRRKTADVSRTYAVCHVIYIFNIFLRCGITVPSFIIVGYVRQILGSRGAFLPPLIREKPWKCPPWIRLRYSSFVVHWMFDTILSRGFRFLWEKDVSVLQTKKTFHTVVCALLFELFLN